MRTAKPAVNVPKSNNLLPLAWPVACRPASLQARTPDQPNVCNAAVDEASAKTVAKPSKADEDEIDALLAQLDAPKAAPEKAEKGGKKKKKGKAAAAARAAEDEDLDALLAEIDGPRMAPAASTDGPAPADTAPAAAEGEPAPATATAETEAAAPQPAAEGGGKKKKKKGKGGAKAAGEDEDLDALLAELDMKPKQSAAEASAPAQPAQQPADEVAGGTAAPAAGAAEAGDVVADGAADAADAEVRRCAAAHNRQHPAYVGLRHVIHRVWLTLAVPVQRCRRVCAGMLFRRASSVLTGRLRMQDGAEEGEGAAGMSAAAKKKAKKKAKEKEKKGEAAAKAPKVSAAVRKMQEAQEARLKAEAERQAAEEERIRLVRPSCLLDHLPTAWCPRNTLRVLWLHAFGAGRADYVTSIHGDPAASRQRGRLHCADSALFRTQAHRSYPDALRRKRSRG